MFGGHPGSHHLLQTNAATRGQAVSYPGGTRLLLGNVPRSGHCFLQSVHEDPRRVQAGPSHSIGVIFRDAEIPTKRQANLCSKTAATCTILVAADANVTTDDTAENSLLNSPRIVTVAAREQWASEVSCENDLGQSIPLLLPADQGDRLGDCQVASTQRCVEDHRH